VILRSVKCATKIVSYILLCNLKNLSFYLKKKINLMNLCPISHNFWFIEIVHEVYKTIIVRIAQSLNLITIIEKREEERREEGEKRGERRENEKRREKKRRERRKEREEREKEKGGERKRKRGREKREERKK
jgi:hypothetical protein